MKMKIQKIKIKEDKIEDKIEVKEDREDLTSLIGKFVPSYQEF